MKHLFKATLLPLLLAIILPATAIAYDFEVDGIYYNINGSEATVTYKATSSWYHNSYSGTVVIPESVTYNGRDYSVTTIDNHAFYGCNALTSITIPYSVAKIGYEAFYACSELSIVNITDIAAWCNIYFVIGMEYGVCSNPLYYAHHLYLNGEEVKNLVIPNSVTTIGDYAFSGCSGLTSVNIPNSVTEIGYLAFSGCSGMTSVTIPNSVTSIGSAAFSGCSGLTNIIVANDNPKYDSRNCNAIIETASNSMIVGCKNTVIPNSVTSIGSSAFSGCNGLTSVTIPNSVTSIGYDAFWGCSGLTNVTIPKYVTSIANNAFGTCINLASIAVESGNPKYDSRDNCNAIIETATNKLLVGCMNTTIPESVTSIGSAAFNGCSGLTSVTIHNSVTTIGANAFNGCSGLKNLTIGTSVSTIGRYAFYGCNTLEIINFNAVWCNYDYIPEDVVDCELDYLFQGLNNITTINFGDSVEIIPERFAFGLSKIKSLNIPNSVISIGHCAFFYCSGLTNINIGSSVDWIGWEAFSGCSELTSVTCWRVVPPYADYPNFDNSAYQNATLYVPYPSIEAYRNATVWNNFQHIVEMEPVFATAIELSTTATSIVQGGTLQITATVLPGNASIKSVTWASNNPAVATVDENGTVTALSAGTATITAMTTDGSNLSASCSVTVKSMSTDNCFSMPDTTAFHGDSIVIPVRLNNAESIIAFQTDICLPEGFTIVTDEDDEPLIVPSNRLTSDHVMMADQLNDGSVRVICYSLHSRAINGNEGDLFYIPVAVPEGAEGDYTIMLRNTLLTASDYTELNAPDAGAVLNVYTYIPGDVNDSRTVTVTDIVFTAQYILQRDPHPFIFAAADMNGDGNITVTDIMLISNLIMTPTRNVLIRMPALVTSSDRMSGEGITLSAGETRTVGIELDNVLDYTAFQLDLHLPDGLTACNFQVTDRAGRHAFDVNAIGDGTIRALCYSPAIDVIDGHSGALLTFEVTATALVAGDITVDGIELVTANCQSVMLDAFSINVNNATAVNELVGGKTIAKVDYFNLAGQQIKAPMPGINLVVTTYTDGSCTTSKVILK